MDTDHFERAVQVLIEIAPTEGTIRGEISVEGTPATDFFGWLELIDRLERAADVSRLRQTAETRREENRGS
jgi:hypothetical protein